ncbi:type VI secretion system baseplate subunit TssG [Novipirellula artificiosorum]|uniref:Type VI secretion protein n=1 Tax=Novipirellula artificiosorum TaxID=2528016 RepID=A0A5C6D878_9BACT|nr:type VI secretion system baseplate subunit TssG [Novipirellula artificiosorum]TWU31951.1 hypothetical protein Poly41_58390 [Novipirellula artificiosorum]
MASPIRKKNPSVIDRLVTQPHRFSFYQAVRLLLASGAARSLGANEGRVGTIENASAEAIRFRSQAALEFPATEIVSVKVPPSQSDDLDGDANGRGQDRSPIEMEIAFWGLVGPVGALPNHYTQLVIDRARDHDTSLLDFLDLFSHRQLSLFYRAWEKYFVPAGVERALRQHDPAADLLRESLLSIVGRGTRNVRDRLEILDDVCVYYGGLFNDRPNAESLSQMVADFLGLDTQVLSLFGQWLLLPPSEQSRLGALDGHSRLGTDTVLGEKVWDPTSKFRISIGPVRYKDFLSLMPTGDSLIPISQLIRSYVGCEFSFDLQVVLIASEIPPCQLGGVSRSELPQANLGWNTWLCSQTPTKDSHDAVFQHDGSPLA